MEFRRTRTMSETKLERLATVRDRIVIGADCKRSDGPTTQPNFRFLAASTRLMMVTADTSSASQMRNSVSTVGDLRFRSSWLM
jgi:hypothetical protein